MRKNIVSALITLMLLAVSATAVVTAEGTTHYVYAGGDIQAAIDNADPGDTILIGPGTYDVGRLIIDRPLTLQGSGAYETELYGVIHLGSLFRADGGHAVTGEIEIADLAVINMDGISLLPTYLPLFPEPCISSYEFDDAAALDGNGFEMGTLSIHNCALDGIGGIYVQHVGSVSIYGNDFFGSFQQELLGVDDDAKHGIYVGWCGSVDISSNYLNFFDWVAIATPYNESVRVVNNLLFGNTYVGIGSSYSGDVAVVNNTLVFNGNGIRVWDAQSAVVANNIIYDSSSQMFDAWVTTVGGLVFENNDIYIEEPDIAPLDGISQWGFPPGFTIILDSDADQYAVSGNIFEDPLFSFDLVLTHQCYAPQLDGYYLLDYLFALSDESPCINAGVFAHSAAYGSVVDDILGMPRPQNGRYDIGCYEVRASYTPASAQPLVATSLAKATSLWTDVLLWLPEELTPEQQAILDEVQSLIEGAGSLGNPIAANGALQRAITLLESL